MGKKKFTPEQIVSMLREAEVLLGEGSEYCGGMSRGWGSQTQTYYRWRKEYGGLRVDQAKRLKELEAGEHEAEEGCGRSDRGQGDPEGGGPGKLLSPAKRRRAVHEDHGSTCRCQNVVSAGFSEQPRSTQRQMPMMMSEEDRLAGKDHGAGLPVRTLWVPADHGTC